LKFAILLFLILSGVDLLRCPAESRRQEQQADGRKTSERLEFAILLFLILSGVDLVRYAADCSCLLPLSF
jgi:hypothetical protein